MGKNYQVKKWPEKRKKKLNLKKMSRIIFKKNSTKKATKKNYYRNMKYLAGEKVEAKKWRKKWENSEQWLKKFN